MTEPLYWQHYNDVYEDEWEWPHFRPAEIACSHCGELLVQKRAMDQLEAVRLIYGRPIVIASGYRCPDHPIEAAKDEPGAHSRGTAFDPYPTGPDADLAEMEDSFHATGVLGRGKGVKDGSLHLHFDWDEVLGKRSWGY